MQFSIFRVSLIKTPPGQVLITITVATLLRWSIRMNAIPHSKNHFVASAQATGHKDAALKDTEVFLEFFFLCGIGRTIPVRRD